MSTAVDFAEVPKTSEEPLRRLITEYGLGAPHLVAPDVSTGHFPWEQDSAQYAAIVADWVAQA